ncbi:hypothetical protein [Porphyromonas pogonae]|uniref:hypothetical protein n=1 Tax=Porphyromonas pogonae TaxID=867595 RepID=UPI002E76E3DD|nr:hypothetical protein [Porphyromonas pogonae]
MIIKIVLPQSRSVNYSKAKAILNRLGDTLTLNDVVVKWNDFRLLYQLSCNWKGFKLIIDGEDVYEDNNIKIYNILSDLAISIIGNQIDRLDLQMRECEREFDKKKLLNDWANYVIDMYEK